MDNAERKDAVWDAVEWLKRMKTLEERHGETYHLNPHQLCFLDDAIAVFDLHLPELFNEVPA